MALVWMEEPMQARREWLCPRPRRGVSPRGFLFAAPLGTFALLLLAWVPAVAQDVGKAIRIGVLALGPRQAPVWRCGPRAPDRTAPAARPEAIPFNVLGLRDELERLGYVEDRPETRGRAGRRFALEVRQGNPEAVKRFAQQFAQEGVDLLFAISSSTVRTAMEATRGRPVPILFPNISDPVGDGFAQSLARPGGLVTGVSTQLVQGSGKRVEVFKQMLPDLRRLLTVYKADFPPAQRSVAEMRKAAADLGIALAEKHAGTRAELAAVMADVRRESVDGMILPSDAVAFANADLVLETSLERRVPAFGIVDFMADWGALGAYGPSDFQAGRRVARYVDKIVNGAKPGELPVEALDPVFAINLKAAGCLGVTIPPTVLHQADRVIR